MVFINFGLYQFNFNKRFTLNIYIYHCSSTFKFYLYLFIDLYRDKYRSLPCRRIIYSLLASYSFVRHRNRQSFPVIKSISHKIYIMADGGPPAPQPPPVPPEQPVVPPAPPTQLTVLPV